MPSPRSTSRSSVSVSTLVSRSIPYSSGGSSLPSIAYSRIPLPASRSAARSSQRVRVDRISARKISFTASGLSQTASSSSSVVRYGQNPMSLSRVSPPPSSSAATPPSPHTYPPRHRPP